MRIPEAGPIRKPAALPPGVTQEMIDASLAANPLASKGGYEGPAPETAASGVTSNSPIPGVDPFALATANSAYERALTSVNSRRGSTLSQYGFKANGFDDSGNPTGLEVDPTSMYGGYQQLLDKQANDSMDAENAGAGRGFSGGLANQAEGRLRYTQGGERLTLGSGLLGSLGSLNQELLGAKDTLGNAKYQAYLDAARTAADAQDYTPYQAPQLPADPTTNAGAIVLPVAKPAAKPSVPAQRAQVLAKKVTANRTGATYVPGRGVISIH